MLLYRALIICGLAFVLGLAGCKPREREAASAPLEPQWNLVLIVMDTVRADHLGCYGYPRETSPNVDAFAQNATRYTRAFSSAPWTLPTHASMFTGLDPFEHGAHTYPLQPGDRENSRPLGPEPVTLAAAMASAGWTTAGFVANNFYLTRRWGLDRGFQEYRVRKAPGDKLNEDVLEWLAQREAEPFFLFVNYIDAHAAYNTRERPGVVDRPVDQRGNVLLHRLFEEVLPPGEEPVPAELVSRVIDQYDVGIANADFAVGQLLDRFDELGLSERTIFVITSDHGEYFGEHRLVAHSKDIYQPGVSIPLLIRAPGQLGAHEEHAPVVSSDLPYMMLSRMPSQAAAEVLRRFPRAPQTRPLIVENYFARMKDLEDPRWGSRFDRVRAALIEWPYKFIESSDGHNELYHLEHDPGEETNIIDEEPGVAERLATVLQQRRSNKNLTPASSAPELTEKEIEAMRALGYVQ